MQSLQEQAEEFARERHAPQKRKFSGEPYVNHPIRVRDLVAEFSQDEELLCAALLHDTLEDTETSMDELRERFGCRVAELVSQLTSDKNL